MAIFIFLVVLFILILVHEWGHFIVAKKTGMRVDEFGIGFPPKLFGKKWHGTEYTLNALPIGGFVRIKGENAEDVSEDGTVENDSFAAKSAGAQAAVLIAGVTMNVLFAWLLFVIVSMVGAPVSVSEDAITENTALTITYVMEGAPADDVVLPLGSEIVSVSSGETTLDTMTPSAFAAFTSDGGGEELVVTYLHKDKEYQTKMTPSQGVLIDDPDRYALGIALSLIENVKKPIHIAMYDSAITTVVSLKAITVGLFSLIGQSIQGTADFSQVAGPVGMVGMVDDAAEFGFTSLLLFMAIISLNLAVINMLPFPALDGGRLVFVAIEVVTRKPINPVWVGRVNLIGFGLLLLLMVAVTWNDVAKML